MQIYIASKAIHRPRWRALRDVGVKINSRWIDIDDKYSTNSDDLDYRKLWNMCVSDVMSATHLVCYVEKGEVLKGALIEVGIALAMEIPVYIVGDLDTFINNGTWINHDNIINMCSMTVDELLLKIW